MSIEEESAERQETWVEVRGFEITDFTTDELVWLEEAANRLGVTVNDLLSQAYKQLNPAKVVENYLKNEKSTDDTYG
ncbi:MAG TPA: hypothetical protein VFH37_01685 [Candidatus Saccharimonadales bacterium]|nr:hypothetical protein [Candidatus Saccharimonadales bacterium]